MYEFRMKFVPKGQGLINNIPALVQMMASDSDSDSDKIYST